MQYRFFPFSSPSGRRRAAALAVCGLAAATVGAGALSGAAGASTSSAKAVVAATRKAILAESAVRVTSTARSTKTHKVTETARFDAGRRTSRQHYATSSARVDILLTPSDAYFSGNKSGLTTLFAMPSNLVAKVGTKWVDVKSSESQYKDFSSAVLASLPKVFLPGSSATKLRLTTTSKQGAKLDVLTWKTSTTSYRLTVPATGRALPIEERQVQGTTSQVTTFGRWNEHIVVHRPHRTIAFASLLGG